jgi:hypothetical protein
MFKRRERLCTTRLLFRFAEPCPRLSIILVSLNGLLESRLRQLPFTDESQSAPDDDKLCRRRVA